MLESDLPVLVGVEARRSVGCCKSSARSRSVARPKAVVQIPAPADPAGLHSNARNRLSMRTSR